MFVPELTEYEVDNLHALEQLIKMGNERRTVAATAANVTSSRSHAILIFNITNTDNTFSKLQIVDLAGSERA